MLNRELLNFPLCRLQPIFIDASCCPVKYDCTFNSTLTHDDKRKSSNDKNSLIQRRNRSNG